MDTPALKAPALKALLAHYKLTPDKHFGQHFLCHGPTLERIGAAVGTASQVLEIGPGPGVLTQILHNEPGRTLVLIEKDTRLAPLLQDHFPGAHLILGDALTQDWAPFAGYTFVSNLPYNVSVPIMIRYIAATAEPSPAGSVSARPGPGPAVFMMQKEVAGRMCASPRTKAYGRLSVITQLYVRPRLVTAVPPSAFWPMPGVQSCVLSLTPYDEWHHVPFGAVERVVEAAFANRRKMIHHNLRPLGWSCQDLQDLQVNPQCRAEDLAPPVFAHLALAYLRRHPHAGAKKKPSGQDLYPPSPSSIPNLMFERNSDSCPRAASPD